MTCVVPKEVVFLITSSAVTTPRPSQSTRIATAFPQRKITWRKILKVPGLGKCMQQTDSDLIGHIYVISLLSSHLLASSLERQIFGLTSSHWHCTGPTQSSSENTPPKPW